MSTFLPQEAACLTQARAQHSAGETLIMSLVCGHVSCSASWWSQLDKFFLFLSLKPQILNQEQGAVSGRWVCMSRQKKEFNCRRQRWQHSPLTSGMFSEAHIIPRGVISFCKMRTLAKLQVLLRLSHSGQISVRADSGNWVSNWLSCVALLQGELNYCSSQFISWV